MNDDERIGYCSMCNHEEPLKLDSVAPETKRFLCYDCWHAEREATPHFCVERQHPDLDSYEWNDGMLQHEAEARAAEINAAPPSGQLPGTIFVAVQGGRWGGSRRAHPGYLKRRVENMRSDPNFELWKEAMGSAIKWWVT
jgi:hypothetical protein